jgi:hypothetical protein
MSSDIFFMSSFSSSSKLSRYHSLFPSYFPVVSELSSLFFPNVKNVMQFDNIFTINKLVDTFNTPASPPVSEYVDFDLQMKNNKDNNNDNDNNNEGLVKENDLEGEGTICIELEMQKIKKLN